MVANWVELLSERFHSIIRNESSRLGAKRSVLRWEYIIENKKVRKKERKHAIDIKTDQEKDKVFILRNINQFYFQPVSAICRFIQIESI